MNHYHNILNDFYGKKYINKKYHSRVPDFSIRGKRTFPLVPSVCEQDIAFNYETINYMAVSQDFSASRIISLDSELLMTTSGNIKIMMRK